MKPLFLIVLPIAVALSINSSISDEHLMEVVVIQPNIDSYTEKFQYNARTGDYNKETYIPHEQQLNILIEESAKWVSSSTKYLIWPETSVPGGYWEESMESAATIQQLQDFVRSYKGLTLITGADTYKAYKDQNSKSVTARYNENIGYYDAFNTALQVNEKGRLSVYHKSKLVPGVERMPYPGIFGFLEYFAIDMGGISGSLGTQDNRSVFVNEKNIAVAPAICYESVFGEFVGEYVKNGAQLIAVITNDNWWDDTPGYKQHFHYARLRAVEHRKAVARAANTGISGFINAKGEVMETLGWNVRGGVKASVPLNNKVTYYAEHGDYIGRLASFIAIAFLLSVIIKRTVKKK